MKRLLFIFTLLSFTSFTQDFESVFLGTNFRGYNNAKMKFVENLSSFAIIYNLHGTKKNATKIGGQTDLFTVENDDEYIKYIKGIEFTVKGFYTRTGDTIPETGTVYDPIFHLEGSDNKTYYWKYQSTKEMYFKYWLVSLNQGETDICDKVTKKTDDFTKEISWSQPLSRNGDPTLSAYEKQGKKSVFMYLRVNGSTLNIGKTGVIILLEGDKRIEKPNADIKVEIETSNSGWDYTTFIELTPDDLKLLSENKILKYRLYIYDGEFKSNVTFKKYANCFLNLE